MTIPGLAEKSCPFDDTARTYEKRGISFRGPSGDHNMPKQTKFVCLRLFWRGLVWQRQLTQFKGFRYKR